MSESVHTGETELQHDAHALTLAALGVVFGDIGTSPLYTMNECLHHTAGNDRTAAVLGSLSLILWSLIFVVTLKYVAFVTRADNQGEGGIFALLALTERKLRRSTGTTLSWGILLILAGAALLYGDGIITPAISVLGASEGLISINPAFHPIVPIASCIILAVLFWAQHKGTDNIGKVFGPVMLIWFSTIGIIGMFQIFYFPTILKALNPIHGLRLLYHHPSEIGGILGAVVLAITGGEALYADMGHFGRKAISRAWHLVVLPGLILSYFGQGAWALRNPDSTANPFFAVAPAGWAQYALTLISVLASIIASQALISGTYSLTRQAVQMGYFPRVGIKHTNAAFEGQIYIPTVNWALALGCIALVLGFRSSDALASAYGIAVTGTMGVTTIAFYEVMREIWHWPRWRAMPVCGFFLIVDIAFFASNLPKIAEGGWLPLMVGSIILAIMYSWKMGRANVSASLFIQGIDPRMLVEDLKNSGIHRVSGTAVFMSGNPSGIPIALLHHLKSNHCLHKTVIILSCLTDNCPYVDDTHRLNLEELGEGVWRAIAHYGYMETPNVPAILQRINDQGVAIKPQAVTYYFNRETILTGGKAKMWKWQKELYALLSRNARPATDYFQIPANQIVEMGLPVKL